MLVIYKINNKTENGLALGVRILEVPERDCSLHRFRAHKQRWWPRSRFRDRLQAIHRHDNLRLEHGSPCGSARLVTVTAAVARYYIQPSRAQMHCESCPVS